MLLWLDTPAHPHNKRQLRVSNQW